MFIKRFIIIFFVMMFNLSCTAFNKVFSIPESPVISEKSSDSSTSESDLATDDFDIDSEFDSDTIEEGAQDSLLFKEVDDDSNTETLSEEKSDIDNSDEIPTSMKLPFDSKFLNHVKIDKSGNNYKKWNSKGRILVGQSHLSNTHLLGEQKYILTMSDVENKIKIFDILTLKIISMFQIPGLNINKRWDITYWPDNNEPYFVLAKNDGIWLYNGLTGEQIKQLNPGEELSVLRLKWSKDNHILMAKVVTEDNKVGILFYKKNRGDSLEEISRIRLPFRISDWDLSSDNRRIAFLMRGTSDVTLFDLHTNEFLWIGPSPGYASSIAISPDGSKIAVGGNQLVVFNAEHSTEFANYSKFGNNICEVKFSNDSKVVVTSSYDGKVKIFSTNIISRTLKLIKTLSHRGTANVYNLLFTSDGKHLVTSSGDKSVMIWGSEKLK